MKSLDGEIRDVILMTAADAALYFAVYSRKEDEQLSSATLEDAIRRGVVTVAEITFMFATELRDALSLDEGQP